ncbi:Ribosome biogenesis protein Nop16 [Teratosphaeria destructans]|uniref:Nucleolar protein 16 n=1 Tax=Teratosphaeria destructans TaxID=418781 RepID=A0A9W7SYS9_9PEZI|nr:Ribosome biogenesis protein Nop16 [Teratosphaeria destructans]
MGRELQKKKNRSGIQKVRQKPKSKKNLLLNPIIAANWDKSQTLEQNYKRIGLTAKLNKHTGGVERKADDVRRAREEAAEGKGKDDPLAIASSSLRRPQTFQVQEAKIERDPATGRILRVIDDGAKRANPLNDPLAELDSEDSDEEVDQHPDTFATSQSGSGMTDVVRKLEQEASRPVKKYKFKQTEGERAFVEELVRKYGDDNAAMARDIKINYMQRSEGDLKRRVKKWREAGGSVD